MEKMYGKSGWAVLFLSLLTPLAMARMSLPGSACQPETQPPLQPLRITGFGGVLLNDGDGSIRVACPLHRVGENVVDLWINVQVDPDGVVSEGHMDCYAVREAMANGVPPSIEPLNARVPLDKSGTQDVRFPNFKEKAGASDVYVITCNLPPKVAIKGYNWEGE